MDPGKYKHYCTVEAPAEGQDEVGQPLTGWVPFKKFWADIRGTAGLETIRADAEISIRKVSIRTRYRTDITAAMRIVCSGVTYNVKVVLPDTVGKKHLDLACEVAT